MDRRTVLKGGIAVALTAHTAVASGEALPSTLDMLISEHTRVLALDKAAWTVVADLSERLDESEGGHPSVRVQTSYLHRGRDADGNDIKTPIYSYSEAEIEKAFADDLKTLLLFNSASRQALVKENCERRLAAKLAEFRKLQAEYDQREQDIGLTEALAEARRIADEVRDIEAEIIALVPATLAEAVQKAAWCARAYQSDDAYLCEHGDGHQQNPLLMALEAIGRASA